MNGLQLFLDHPVVLNWGWVLLHFLWQGLLVSLVAWGVLTATAGKSARFRYLLATGCLFLSLVCPLAIWFSLEQPSRTTEVSSENVDSVSPVLSTVSPTVVHSSTIASEPAWELPVENSLTDVPTPPANSPSALDSGVPSAAFWTTHLERGLPWVVAAWLLGVLILSLRLAGGWFVARNCVMRGVPLREEWAQRVPEFLARLNLSRSIRWIESSRIRVPQVMGWLKPVVLVPSSMFTTLSPAEIECLLLHELVHIRRYDYLVNLLQCVAETVFFYHPGVLWLSRRIRLERELACDEAVVSLTDDKITFSRALLSLAEHAQLPQPTLAASEGDLTARIRAILGQKRKGATSGFAVWVCLVACAISLGVLFVPDSQASSQHDKSTEAASRDQDSPSANKRDAQGEDGNSRAHLTGKIVDREGHSVAGANVYTSNDGKKYSKVSGADGEFSLDVPRPGPLRNLKSMLVFAETDEGRLQGTAYIKLEFVEDQPAEPTEILLQPARQFGIIVSDVASEPVSGATVLLLSSNSPKPEEQTTDAEGRALLVVSADLPLGSIFAFKKGVGIADESFRSASGGTNISLYSKDAENPVLFNLQPCRPVTVHVIDTQKRPVPGARVSFLDPRAIPGFSRLSDVNGNVTFDLVPWNVSGAPRIVVYKEGYIGLQSTRFHPEAATWEVTAELTPKLTVKGQVTTPDGQPVADAEVRASGRSYNDPSSRGGTVRTNADGRFELLLPPMTFYSFLASKGDFISPTKELIIYEEVPVEPLQLQLVPATRVNGRIAVGEGKEPYAEMRVSLNLQPQQVYSELAGISELPDPYGYSKRWRLDPTHYRRTTTDPQGRFEFMLGPGTYHLNEVSPGKPYEFKVEDGRELELDVHFPRNSRRRTASRIIVTPPDDGVPLAGRVVSKADPDGGVPNVRIKILPHTEYSAPYHGLQTDADGVFTCQRAPKRISYIYAETQDRRQAAMKTIGPEDVTVNLSIQPLTSVSGRLVDALTGQPLGGENIKCAVEYKTGVEFQPFSKIHGRTVKTESDGSFTIDGLLPDWEYVIRADRVRGKGFRDQVWVRVGRVTPKAGDEPLDMGDLNFETHRPASLKP